MKKLLIILAAILTGVSAYSQQIPISENYYMDKYSLAPSYAGAFNPKFLFMGYRSDWTGIDGGPKTMRLSYSDVLAGMENAGWGGKLVYDKAGIFNQLNIMGSYSYKIKISNDHLIMFGLSAGIYKNRLNLLDYYNDPKYTLDPSLISADVKSKVKFMSDFSAVWSWNKVEAGVVFSNISIGDASYKEVDLKYNPLANYQFHATYQYNINDQLDLSPLVIIRGGKYIKSQFELAAQLMYLKRFWGSLMFRDPGVFGIGAGAFIDKGIIIGYNFNFATNVAMGVFNNHEITIGFNIFEYLHKAE
jgi:type IX secretion system PorP/SprF family membrane protein